MRQTVRTILHLSDLHIGDIDPVKCVSSSDPAANISLTQYLPGNLGHDDRAVRAVANLWRSISEQGDADLIITGDVTAFGSNAHYANAVQFVDQGLLQSGQRVVVGLQQNGARGGIIPGNHDYFAGAPIPWGATTQEMTDFFYPPGHHLPRSNWILDLPDGRKLEFLAIDCDFDFRYQPGHRILARESGEMHLLHLMNHLQQDPNFVRVLLLHGSVAYRHGIPPLYEILHAADGQLQTFCQMFNVVSMLCGHIHVPYLGPLDTWPAGNRHELRCGTSMQLRYHPKLLGWIKRFLSPNTPPNIALVHRLRYEDGRMTWEVETQWLPSGKEQFESRHGRYSFDF